jgi:hypothetical protein
MSGSLNRDGMEQRGLGNIYARGQYGVTDRKLLTRAMCTPGARCAYEKNAASGRSAAVLTGGIALDAIAEGQRHGSRADTDNSVQMYRRPAVSIQE